MDIRMEEQVETVRLLEAMYPLPSELVIGTDTRSFLDNFESGSVSPLKTLDLTLRLNVDDNSEYPIELCIALPLTPDSENISISIRQPKFLNRAAFERLQDTIPTTIVEVTSSEAILAIIDQTLQEASKLLADSLEVPAAEEEAVVPEKLERVWFWFPSLSTKEKRQDLVDYAPRFGLTGFVLAGKPGLLCLEGDGRQVDRYMGAIKSESWGDIPSYQKKVTERLRNSINSSDRRFTTMTEITHLIPQRGVHNNRGEMTEVKRLMDSWGVGDDFGSVVLNNGT